MYKLERYRQLGLSDFNRLTKLKMHIRNFVSGKTAGSKRLTPEKAFFILSLLNISIMIILIMCSGGQAIIRMGYGESNFGDFWAHIRRLLNGNDIYGTEADAIYPPLVSLFMKLFAIPLSHKIDAEGVYNMAAIRSSGFGGLILVLYFTLFFIMFASILSIAYKTNSNLKKNAMMGILLFSYPFWGCAFERGNPVLFAMLFLWGGIVLKDSDSKFLKELALIFVAISAGFKLYPALFGFIWLAEKRYKEAVRLIVYGLIAFFVPFLFLGSFKSYLDTFALYLDKRVYSQTSVWGNIFLVFGNNTFSQIICRIIIAAIIIWAIICLYTDGVNWKTITLLTATQTIIIPQSYVYTYVFIVIPLILFMNEGSTRKIDYIYAILFSLVFTIPPFLKIQSAVLIGIYISWIVLLLLVTIEEIRLIVRKI